MAVIPSSRLRLSGLSSGIDTDAVIKQMMQIHQLKIDKQFREVTKLGWRQEALTGIKDDLTAFKNTFMSALSPKNLLSENAFNTYAATVTGKNSGAITVSTTTGASIGKTTVSQVKQMAKGTTAGSHDLIRAGGEGSKAVFKEGSADQSKVAIKDAEFETALQFGDANEISFSINGEVFTFSEDATMDDILSSIRNNTNVNVYAQLNSDTGKLELFSRDTGINSQLEIKNITGNAFGENGAFGYKTGTQTVSGISKNGILSDNNLTQLKDLDFAQELEFVNGQISFAINGQTFTFSETDTLSKMMTTINANASAGVTMAYSRLTDEITFTSKQTGSNTSLHIENISGNAFGADSAFRINEGYFQNGKNAKVVIDGMEVEQASNNFSIDGINYTLNYETAEGDEPIEIAVKRDVTAAVDKIKEFVEGYNTLINKLESLVTTRKSNKEQKYVPLTDEEKSAMSEEQIKQWEDIAKKGLFYNDNGLRGLVSSLRSALYETIEVAGIGAFSVGLGTGSYIETNAKRNGEIQLDEDKLKAALENSPEQVMAMFATIDNSSDRSVAYKNSGFLNRVNIIMDNYMKGTQKTTLSGLEESIRRTTSSIDTLTDKMYAQEERLYAQYAAMEEALAKIQSQSDWLAGMLGNTGG